MDIESLSVDMSQANVQEQAAVKVQAMAQDAVKQQAEAVVKLISSVPVPETDPNLGQNIDLTA
ncbi:YjfB family protein [Treponema sp. R6D11]